MTVTGRGEARVRIIRAAIMSGQGYSGAQICQEFGVTRQTLTKWRATKAYKEALAETRDQVLKEARAVLAAGVIPASEVLVKVCSGEIKARPEVVVKAAEAILNRSGMAASSKVEHVEETVPRQELVARLERALKELRSASADGDDPDDAELIEPGGDQPHGGSGDEGSGARPALAPGNDDPGPEDED